MDELERWTTGAPEPFLQAKAAHAQLGPDEAQLNTMIERLERALPAAADEAQPAAATAAPRLGRMRLSMWLAPALTLLLAGAYFLTRTSAPTAPVGVPPVQMRPAPASSGPLHAVPAPTLPPPTTVQREPVAAPTPARQAPVAPERTPDPAAELTLLERARRTLARDPARALALTDEHRRTFHPGLFAEERELLAIEALVGLARRDAAERRARAFTRSHPNSVHAHRLQTILQRATP